MDNNKIIIGVLVAIIITLLIGILLTMPNFTKTDSILEITGNSTIVEGDSLQIRLTDANGTALANQTVNVTVTDSNKTSEHHSLITDDDGIGELKLENDAGEYGIDVSYGGNGKYNGCNANKTIEIEQKEVEAQTTSSSSSSLPYSIDNLPPSNDPYPETRRYQVDEYFVIQEYEDNYRSTVDLRTGERHGGFF